LAALAGLAAFDPLAGAGDEALDAWGASDRPSDDVDSEEGWRRTITSTSRMAAR
jgi:hypothetical protein